MGHIKNVLIFDCRLSGNCEINKKQSGNSFAGHPVISQPSGDTIKYTLISVFSYTSTNGDLENSPGIGWYILIELEKN